MFKGFNFQLPSLGFESHSTYFSLYNRVTSYLKCGLEPSIRTCTAVNETENKYIHQHKRCINVDKQVK